MEIHLYLNFKHLVLWFETFYFNQTHANNKYITNESVKTHIQMPILPHAVQLTIYNGITKRKHKQTNHWCYSFSEVIVANKRACQSHVHLKYIFLNSSFASYVKCFWKISQSLMISKYICRVSSLWDLQIMQPSPRLVVGICASWIAQTGTTGESYLQTSSHWKHV